MKDGGIDAQVDAQVDRFIDRYTPEIQSRVRAARDSLRALFPRGYELVFDNYNALVFGFSPTDRTTGSFVSIAAYPRWVTLFFLDGVRLDDPHGLLEGDGRQVRSIRLARIGQVDEAEVRALINQASAPHAAAFADAPKRTTIARTVVEKQRPRRPAARA